MIEGELSDVAKEKSGSSGSRGTDSTGAKRRPRASMGKRYDTYKYQFKLGKKIVHGGITDDLERREQEHQKKWPMGHIKQVGRRTTEDAARKWEKEKGYSKE